MSRRRRRKRSLEGTGLYQHGNGGYYHRRVDPLTGDRTPVYMGRRLDVALKRAAERDLELQARAAGRPTQDAWGLLLEPLIEGWLASCEYHNPRTAQNTRMRIYRVVEALGLKTTGDLRSVARIDDRLRALEGETPQNQRRGYQQPLKQISAWLAENQRVLDHDPLQSWAPIPFKRSRNARRCALPGEYARALAALDYLGVKHGHTTPQRPLFTTLLVVGARAGAVTSRLVRHLFRRRSRLDLGGSVGKKGRGEAVLDKKTLEELCALVAGRGGDEPLFLAPRGGTQDTARARDLWEQASSLALVDDLWPADAPLDLDLALLVSRSLLAGVARVGVAGNPRLVTREHRKAVAARRRRVANLVGLITDEWKSLRRGLLLASTRHTHHTWARVLGVPEPCINKQIGHSSPGGGGAEVIRAVLGSRTGSRHYLDMSSTLIDASLSAQAVRDRLDKAEDELRANRRSLLGEWIRSTKGTSKSARA